MNKFTLNFHSDVYEKQYSQQFVSLQVRVHKVDTIIWMLVFGIYFILCIYYGRTFETLVSLSILATKAVQYYLICCRYQIHVGLSLCFSNILISILEFAYYNPGTQSEAQKTLLTMAVTIYQIGLLTTSSFIKNALTFTLVIGFKLIVSNINQFNYSDYAVFGASLIYIWILYERTLELKMHFVSLLKESIAGIYTSFILDDIIQNQMNDSILIADFDQDNLGFKLVKNNSVFRTTFKVDETGEMRAFMRTMKLTDQKVNLEKYLFILMRDSQKEVEKSETINCRIGEDQYLVSVKYQDLFQKRILLIIHSQNDKIENEMQQKQILNLRLALRRLTISLNRILSKPRHVPQENANILISKNLVINMNFLSFKSIVPQNVRKFNVVALLMAIKRQVPKLKLNVLIPQALITPVIITDQFLITHLFVNILREIAPKMNFHYVVQLQKDKGILKIRIKGNGQSLSFEIFTDYESQCCL